MSGLIQQFYHFLAACGGNWRCAVYISCPGCPDHRGCAGHLLAPNTEGKPVLMAVRQFQRLSGEIIDPEECRGRLDRKAFEDIFRGYLLWALPDASPCVLRRLTVLE